MKKKVKLQLFLSAMFILVVNQSLFATDKPDVIIKDFKFIPQHITIKRGQTLRWENQEKRQYHSVWFEALGEEEPVDYLFADDSYEREFKQSGTFPYRCGPHPKMTGTVTVTE